MNWKLIFSLSLFGLAMAFATITLVPSPVEPLLWVAIFVFCAYTIAKRAPGKFFLHGFFVGLVNCIWITSAHIIFSTTYLQHHAQEAAQYSKMNAQMGMSPMVAMAVFGPLIGIASGLVIGLFSWIASKLLKSRESPL
jgi:uncharacterized membrane protein